MQKTVQIDGLDAPVLLTRRKGSRSIRISVKSDGAVRVNVPFGVPEFVAKRFVQQKITWIQAHQKPTEQLNTRSRIGKHHTLYVRHGATTRNQTKVTQSEVIVTLKNGLDEQSDEAQKVIKKACEKALTAEAEQLLPLRVAEIAAKFGIAYAGCSIQKLKSRWGACDNRNNLSFNCYLMQLDWVLIDYVICHELAHTIHHHHQPTFWEFVEKLYPKYKTARKVLKTKRTDVVATYF
jgi:predicted metal-dependent hydrolase